MRDFTIGGVIGQTFQLIGRHAAILLVLSVLLVGLPKLVGSVILVEAMSSGYSRFVYVLIAVPQLLTAIGGIFLEIAVVRIAADAADHRRPTIGRGLGEAARLFFPVLAVWLLSSLAIALGMVLLIVPGVMLACRWIVAVPAQIIERPGISAAFRRSGELTKGCRWRIFGLALIVALVGGTVSFAISLLLGITGWHRVDSWAQIGLGGLFSTLIGLVSNAGIASIHLDLRRVKEGALSQELVSVFD